MCVIFILDFSDAVSPKHITEDDKTKVDTLNLDATPCLIFAWKRSRRSAERRDFMTNKKDDSQKKPKISPKFIARLKRLEAGQLIQAIVMLDLEQDRQASTKRQSPAERKAAIEAIRLTARPVLAEIDQILDRYEGKRLAAEVSAVGSIPVETTVAGITALADSEHVKSILEDQPISLLSKSNM